MKYHVLIGPVVLIVVWAGVSYFHFVDPFFLPSPFATLGESIQLIFHGSIMHDVLATLERVAAAFFIATCGGLPLGFVLGSSEKLYRSCEFMIDFFRSLPATAMFPLFLLIFGITDQSKIAVAGFASLLIVMFHVAYGVMHAKKTRLLAAKIMGAKTHQLYRWILFWESLPQTFVGLRNALSLSLVIVIVTEMFIGTNVGLGKKIVDFQLTYDMKGMYTAIFLAGLMGYLLNLIFATLEKRWLHWSGK